MQHNSSIPGTYGQDEKIGFMTMLKKGLYGSFYALRKSNRFGKKYLFFTSLVRLLQLMYFPLSPTWGIPWPSTMQNTIVTGLNVVVFGFVDFSSQWMDLIVAFFTFGWIVLMVLGLVMLGMDEINNVTKRDSIVTFVEVFVRFGTTIFIVPFGGVLIKLTACSETQYEACSGALGFLVKPIALITLLIFSLICMFTSLLLVRQPTIDGSTKNTVLLAHGRVECLTTFVVGLLAVTNGMCTTWTTVSSGLRNIWVVLLVVSGIVLTYFHVKYLPYINMLWNRISIGSFTIFLWEAVCAVLALAISDPNDWSARIMFFVCVPFVVYTVMSFTDVYIAKLKNVELELLSPYTCEIRLRLLHMKFEGIGSGEIEFSGQTDADYRASLVVFPNSAYLRLTIAELCSTHSKKIMMALTMIREIRDLALGVDHQFFMFCLNKRNYEREKNGAGAANFMKFDRHLEAAREKLLSAMEMRNMFWMQLNSGKFTKDNLVEYGTKIYAETKICKSHITSLLRISNSHAEAIRLHALYAFCILNDPVATADILSKNTKSLTEAGESHGYAVVTVSGDAETLGQIIEATEATCIMFGYSKKNLIGRSVNILCPAPFDKLHDLFLKQFLSQDADFETQTRMIYGSDSEGFIFPVEFIVTPSTNQQSDLILIGKFQQVVDENKQFLMVDGFTHMITSCSKGIPYLLDIDYQDVTNKTIHIADVFPDFFDDDGTCKYAVFSDENKVHIEDETYQVEAKEIKFFPKDASKIDFSCCVFLVTMSRDVFKEEDEFETGDAELDQFLQPKGNPASGGATSGAYSGITSGQQTPTTPKYGSSTKRRLLRNAKTSAEIKTISNLKSKENAKQVHQSRRFFKAITRKLKEPDPRIHKYRWQLKLFVLLFTIGAIVEVVLLATLFNGYKNITAQLDQAQIRNQNIANLAVVLEMWRNPVIEVQSTVYARNFPDVLAYLNQTLPEVKNTHLDLVNNGVAVSNAKMDSLMNDPLLQITQDGVSFQDASYNFAVLSITEHMDKIIQAESSDCGASCRYILNNAMFDIAEYGLASLSIYAEESANALYRVYLIVGIIHIVILAILLVSFVYVFLPMCQSSESVKRNIASAFATLTPEAVDKLHTRGVNWVNLIKQGKIMQVFEAPEDSLPSIVEKTDSGMWATMLQRRARARQALRENNIPEQKKTNRFLSFFRCNKRVSAASNKPLESRVVLINDSVIFRIVKFLQMMLSFGAIVGLVLGFQLASFLTLLHEKSSIEDIQGKIYAMTVRGSLVAYSGYWLVQIPNNTSDGFRSDYWDDLIMEQNQATLLEFSQALEYGNISYGIQYAYTETTGGFHDIMFADACSDTCAAALDSNIAYYFNSSSYATLLDLKYGIYFAIEEQMNRVMETLSYRQNFKLNSTLSDAYYSNVATFDIFEGYDAMCDIAGESTNILVSIQQERISSGISTRSIVTTCFVLAILILYSMTIGMLDRVDRELKNSRALIFMVPREFIKDVSKVSKLLFGKDDLTFK